MDDKNLRELWHNPKLWLALIVLASVLGLGGLVPIFQSQFINTILAPVYWAIGLKTVVNIIETYIPGPAGGLLILAVIYLAGTKSGREILTQLGGRVFKR